MGLDMVVNPEQEAAAEIARVLRFPTAINVETFVDGKVEMVSFRIKENDILSEKSISSIMAKLRLSLIFCAVVHNGEVIIPDGNYIAHTDDLFYVIGEPAAEVYKFFKAIKRETSSSKSAFVIGGGRIAYYLCKFTAEIGINTKLVELNRDKCYELNEALPKCVVINGDGSDPELLEEEDMASYRSVVTITGRDEENLLIAIHASRLGVPKVIAKINRPNYDDIVENFGIDSIISPKNITAVQIIRFVRALNNLGVPKVIAKINRPNYDDIVENFGIDSIISPKNITAVQIIRFVRALNNSLGHANIETLYHIVDGQAEALEFHADSTTMNTGIPFKDIKFRKNLIVAAIERNWKVIIPSGNDCIYDGDSVVIVCRNSRIYELNDVFENGGR